MFGRTARFYDAIYSFKDYVVEAARIAEEVRRRNPRARTLLDVACGTGKHLERLKVEFEVAGVDLDPALLEVARERLPDVPLYEGDMMTLDLGLRFDAVTCLFSSVGYTRTPERLRAAIAAMARHLEPGGVLVVEPWLTSEEFEEGRVSGLFVDEPEFKVARMNTTAREGDVSVLEFHYLIGERGAVSYESEEHRLGLFTVDDHLRAFERAGLSVEHDEVGLTGRGLYLGRAPG